MNILLRAQILLTFVIYVYSELVQLKYGQIEGTVGTSKNGRSFYKFYAIPYAEPPIKDLRFKAPVPVTPWSGIKDCSKPPPKCIQSKIDFDTKSGIGGQEDCLYLNVFVPSDLFKSTNKTAVLVGIHGGGFRFGSSLDYNPEYFMDKNVILVTINYRLGMLGFFGLNNDEISGNFGLKDQSLALRWINENIDEFGGDPSSITLVGESAGAASVHLHMFSPLSKGLFHKAIAQSGSAFFEVTCHNSPEYSVAIALAFVIKSHCFRKDSQKILKCLQRIPHEELYSSELEFYDFYYKFGIMFNCMIETNVKNQPFLQQKPSNDTYQTNVPWITGINSGEGAMFAARYLKNKTLLKIINSDRKKMIPRMNHYSNTGDPEDIDNITQKITDFYFGSKDIGINTALNMTNMMTDSAIMYPFMKAVRSRRSEKQFIYLYDHKGSFSFQNLIADLKIDLGVCHADELPLLYRREHLEKKWTPQDKKVSETLVNFWSNFAIFGDPNGLSEEKVWKPVETDELEYLHIKSESLTMEKNLFKQRYEFWESLPAGWKW